MPCVRKVNSLLGLDHIVSRVLVGGVLTQEAEERAAHFVSSHHLRNSEFFSRWQYLQLEHSMSKGTIF